MMPVSPGGSLPAVPLSVERDDSRDARGTYLHRKPAASERNRLEPTGLLVSGLLVQYEAVPAAETSTFFGVAHSAGLSSLFDVGLVAGVGAVNVGVQLVSSVLAGTAPLVITSPTLVANLNADLLDGNEASAFATAVHTHAAADITSGTLDDARVASSNVTQHAAVVFAGGVRTGTTPPSSPTAGMKYYDTVDECEYTYDATRSAWLGPSFVVTANNISAAATMYLRFGNQISSGSRGWPTPFPLRIVGGAISSGASATADLEARLGGASQGVVVSLAASTNGYSTSTDISFAAGVELALFLTASSGTPSAVIADLVVRREKL